MKLWLAAVAVLGSAAPAEAAPCSDADAIAIASKLRLAWKSAATLGPVDGKPSTTPDPSGVTGIRLEGPNNAYIDLSCVGGAFGGNQPRYYIDAIDNRHRGETRIRKRYRQLVTRDGKVVASMPTVDDMERQLEHAWSYKVLDLDGDGIDEILATDAFEHNALAASTTVHVLAVRGAKVVEIGSIGIESSGTMWPTCTGKLVEEKAGKGVRLVLVADKVTKQEWIGQCPTEGKHPHAIVGGKLVEVDAAGLPVKTMKR